MSGYRRANSPAHCQWVVARLPSSRPAAASVNVPTHIAAIRTPLWAEQLAAPKLPAGQALPRSDAFPVPR